MEGVLEDVMVMERDLGRFGMNPSLSDVVWENQVHEDGNIISADLFLDSFRRVNYTLPRCIQYVYRWLTTYGPNVIRITCAGTRLEYRLRALKSILNDNSKLLTIERELRRIGFKLIAKSDVMDPESWKVWSVSTKTSIY